MLYFYFPIFCFIYSFCIYFAYTCSKKFTIIQNCQNTYMMSMLQELDWETTSSRRSSADLICFFKSTAQVNCGAITISDPKVQSTVFNQLSSDSILLHRRIQEEFLPRAIRLWNTLQSSYKRDLQKYLTNTSYCLCDIGNQMQHVLPL